MNNTDFKTFVSLLENEDKDQSLTFILDLLRSGTKVKDVYEKYLIPALSEFDCHDAEEICIWKEHVRTSIIRTILESSYEFIIRERRTSVNKKILVVCPQEEYHEIGAIIASHYFALSGFTSIYVGANTPNDNVISAIKAINPDYLAISVTNYYNVVVTKKLTEQVKMQFPGLGIILGGQAFTHPGSRQQVTYDYLLESLNDIFSFGDEVVR